MESGLAEMTERSSHSDPIDQEEQKSIPKVEEGGKKEKLTKEEKKLKHGLSEPKTTWRCLLKELLSPVDKVPRTPEVEKEATEIAESALYQIFGEAANPYEAAFDIYDIFADREKYKRVHKCLFNTLEAWLKKCSTPEKTEKWLTGEFKVDIMERIVNKGTGQLEALLRIFQLKHADVADLVNTKIQEICTSSARQQFGEAMKLALHFDLHDKFDIELFIIPQLLKNKQDDVERFVKGHIKITMALVKFLDNMIEESDNFKMGILQPYIDRKIVTKEAAYKFINDKRIPNMLKKIVTLEYGMNDLAAPKYTEKRTKDHLRYLLFDRDGTDWSFSTTIFDHIKNHIKKGSRMCKDVIIALFDRIDRHDKKEDKATYYKEAEMWMLYYDLNPYDFFSKIANYFSSRPGWREDAKRMLEKYDTGDAMSSDYKLEDGTPIEWINNWKEIEKMLYEIEELDEDSMIGIDSEFKSTTNSRQEIALLQVSSTSKVYLVDFETLENILSAAQWNTFTSRLFGGNHMKIGFDMLSDIKAYCCTIPSLTEDLQMNTMTRVICLKRLTNDLLDMDTSIINLSGSSSWMKRREEGKNPEEDAQRAIKLSDLVEVLLGKQLDKTLQKSNWSQRPLRPEQMIYAATDANILIKLFFEFGKLAMEKGYDYMDMVKGIENDLAERKETPSEKKKKAKMTDEDYAALVEKINGEVMAANEVEGPPKSFITDSSFAGLGKHLRRLGVDVIFADSKEHLLRLGKEKQHQSRIILSYGKHIAEYEVVFGKRVFVVGIGMNVKDQVRKVLTAFKMKLSPADVFTRCMLCNGDSFVMVPSIVLQTLHDCAKRVGAESYDDELFKPFPFKEKIEKADPSDYGGFECVLTEFDVEDDRFIVQCTNGVVDIYNNLVKSDFLDSAVEVQTLRVQPEVVDSDRRFYYLCGSCGKVYWDGTHGARYKEFVDDVVGADSTPDVTHDK